MISKGFKIPLVMQSMLLSSPFKQFLETCFDMMFTEDDVTIFTVQSFSRGKW